MVVPSAGCRWVQRHIQGQPLVPTLLTTILSWAPHFLAGRTVPSPLAEVMVAAELSGDQEVVRGQPWETGHLLL